MSSFETTELKLRTTPTGGVSGEHSPYYRRLLSAGYKGFMQGTIGGAGLYGFMGLVIGGLVAVPLMFTGVGAAALFLAPAAAGVGLLKGASTFGNIGTVAAISAESADMAEQRRYLLDRYYDLPDGPEGDAQAALIKNELQRLQHTDRPHPFFHWKTVAICAAIGAALAFAMFSPLGMELLAETPVAHVLKDLAAHATAGTEGLGALFKIGAHGVVHATPVLTGLGTIVGAGLGALAGTAVGVDRHYIRKWFDASERMLHDESHTNEALHARGQQIERLREAQKMDNQTKLILERRFGLGADGEQKSVRPTYPPIQATGNTPEISKLPVASLDAPEPAPAFNDNARPVGVVAGGVQQDGRIAEAHKIQAPVL